MSAMVIFGEQVEVPGANTLRADVLHWRGGVNHDGGGGTQRECDGEMDGRNDTPVTAAGACCSRQLTGGMLQLALFQAPATLYLDM